MEPSAFKWSKQGGETNIWNPLKKNLTIHGGSPTPIINLPPHKLPTKKNASAKEIMICSALDGSLDPKTIKAGELSLEIVSVFNALSPPYYHIVLFLQ